MSGQALDLTRLGTWLRAAIPGFGELREAVKFTGGQSNPTYRIISGSGAYVLRRKPPGALLRSAHAVDREYRVLSALADTAVPVPKVFALCEDEGVIGSMFYVMEFVPGRVFWDPALPGQDPPERAAIYRQLNQVMAAIHTVDLAAVGLADFGRPGNYYERQFARWSKQFRASETEPIPEMEALMAWLEAHMVADDGRVALIHGDYRMDNVMFAPDAPRAVAVVDWELSTLGHPYADLAYQCMLWRWRSNPALNGLGGLDLAALGIPGEAEYVAEYCRRVGREGIPDWEFYIAFGAFRFAAIVQGVLKRALDGNASNERAIQFGALARPFAVLGLDAIGEVRGR